MARSGNRIRRRLQRVIERDGDKCVWCSTALHPLHATLEHAVPCSDGGSHRLENLLIACASCNNDRKSVPLLKWFRICEERGYEVQVEVVMAALDRLHRIPEKMRRPVLAPVTAPIVARRVRVRAA